MLRIAPALFGRNSCSISLGTSTRARGTRPVGERLHVQRGVGGPNAILSGASATWQRDAPIPTETAMHIAETRITAAMIRLDTALATHIEANTTTPAIRRVTTLPPTVETTTPVGSRGLTVEKTVARPMNRELAHRCRADRSNIIRVIAGRR